MNQKVWVLMGYTLGKYDSPDVIGVYRDSSTMLYALKKFISDTYSWTEEEIMECIPSEMNLDHISWEDEEQDEIAWAWLTEVQ